MLLLFPALTQTSTYHTFLIAQLQYLSHSLHYIITQTSSLPTYLIACITLNKPVLISLSALHNYTTQYISLPVLHNISLPVLHNYTNTYLGHCLHYKNNNTYLTARITQAWQQRISLSIYSHADNLHINKFLSSKKLWNSYLFFVTLELLNVTKYNQNLHNILFSYFYYYFIYALL